MRKTGLRSLLTGIFVGTSFIPFYPWAIYFCWIPLWREWVDNPDPKKVFKHGWLAQFIFTLIGFYWIGHVAHEFGQLPQPVAILILLVFAGFANLHVPLAGLVWAWLNKKYLFSRQQNFILVGLTLILFEYGFPMIFPWNMGYTWLYAGWPSYNLADIFGFQGLSAITILINILVALGIESARNSRPLRTHVLGLVMILIILNLGGLWHGQKWNKKDSQLTFLQVQANIGNFEKYYAERKGYFRDYILDRYIELSREGLKAHPDAQVVMWPETAMPDKLDDFMQFGMFPKNVRDRIKEIGKPVITGAYSADPGSMAIYNAMFFFNDKGALTGPAYRKSILLAFGEYFPGAQWFPKLKDLVPAVSDFGRGTGATVRPLLEFFVGPQICYEGLFPDYSRDMLAQGAQLFVNTTNDSWYDKLFEPNQHMYMTFGRAIEFRRPLIRATNTGISTAITADGLILGKTPMNTAVFQKVTVPFLKEAGHTFFERNGKYIPLFFLLFWITYLSKIIMTREPRRQ